MQTAFESPKTIGRGHQPRLLLLSSEFPPGPGGIGTHAFQLARHLSRLGWAVRVASPQPYTSAGESESFNRRQPFSVTAFPDRDSGRLWWAQRARAVAVAVREDSPAIVLATGRRAVWTAAAVHALTRTPWVAVGHGTEFVSGSPLVRAMTRRAIEGAAAVIAVSEYTAALIRQSANPKRLIVIPNAADGERFRTGLEPAGLRERLDLGHRRVLLTVGQVGERKAQDVVIRAMPQILSVYPDTCYVMAGLPRKQAEFEALAAELNVAHRVRFAGLLADAELANAYNLADLFVLVSRQATDGDVEGYGIVVQEAALCGVPAVVSRGCGLTEAIREGETGLSVPPNDPQTTAATILALLAADERRLAMGRRARELALTATWSERANEYDRVLRELIAPEPGLAR